VNKTELVQEVAECADIPKTVADKAVKAVLEAVSKQLALGNSVVLTGFGTFSTKERAARTGRNPKTGDPIEIAAAKIPNFKAGKTLKDIVNN
jgi:DNA-binding protein HU-beta